jgi:predicted Zn-dependent peptidase
MSEIRETVLPSGVRVVTDPMDTVETVSIGIWVEAGTRHEPAPINGISHMLEHMAFKGTERRSAQDIAEEMDNVGGHLNAYTARDHTAYYAKILKDDTALAVDIIGDILLHSVMDPVELEREQGVVIQEIGQSLDTPDDVVFDHFQSTAYPDQPLGRPVLGTEPLVRAMSSETILDYMRGQYSASSMILSAAGKIDHDQIVDLAHAAFDSIPDFSRPPPEGGLYKGGDFRESRDIEQVNLLLGFNGVAYEDSDYYASQVLSTVLGGGMSSRLFQEIREKRGLVYSIYSFGASYSDSGLFGVFAGCGEDDVTELLPVMCQQILDITENVSDIEVNRAKAQLKASILMGLESTSSRAETLARQIAIHGRFVPVSEMVQKVEAITPLDVTRTAKRLFGTLPTVAALGPIARIADYDTISGMLRL